MSRWHKAKSLKGELGKRGLVHMKEPALAISRQLPDGSLYAVYDMDGQLLMLGGRAKARSFQRKLSVRDYLGM